MSQAKIPVAYYHKPDKRLRATQDKLFTALQAYYETGNDFNTLQVTKLCQNTGVACQTFYRHYDGIGEMAVMMLSPRIELDGQKVDLHSFARIFTRLTKQNGVWKILDGDCIYERDELVPVLPGAPIKIDMDEIASYRDSYQGLCYVMARTGLTSSQDLPGEDQPETVAKLYGDASEWFFN